MKKILVLWYTIGKNFGDVYIYNTIYEILNKKDFQVEYMEVGESYKKIIEKAKEYDFLLFAGGGIIERWVPDVIVNFKMVTSQTEIPYGVIGIGVGGFDYSNLKDQLYEWVENACFFYTRDEYSAEQLLKTCGTLKNITVGVDIVWANKSIVNESASGKKRGINIRDVPYLDIWDDMDWDTLSIILQDNKFDKVISDCAGIDLGLSDDMSKNFGYYPEKVLEDICQCNIIVAMRYHVVLAAVANGIPVIPIIYCPKVENLACQVGIRDYAIYVDEIDILDDKIKEIMCKKDDIKKMLKKSYECMRGQAEILVLEAADKINNVLKGKEK